MIRPSAHHEAPPPEPRASARGCLRDSTRGCIPRASLAMLLACVISSAAHAEEPKKNDPPKQPDPAPAPAPAPAAEPDAEDSPTKLPTLDELLGLDNPADERTKGLLEDYDPDKVQLERKLTAQEAAEKLEQAVQQMHETAFRLEQIRDPGIVTQRLQAEILTKLDVLIKNAESQQQSSGQSQQSQGQQQQQQQQQMPQQGNQAQQQSEQTGTQDGGANPAFQEGQRDQLDAARAAWGALPDRVRDRLMEGSSDYFSEWYRALTEAYYKRIAEEASK